MQKPVTNQNIKFYWNVDIYHSVNIINKMLHFIYFIKLYWLPLHFSNLLNTVDSNDCIAMIVRLSFWCLIALFFCHVSHMSLRPLIIWKLKKTSVIVTLLILWTDISIFHFKESILIRLSKAFMLKIINPFSSQLIKWFIFVMPLPIYVKIKKCRRAFTHDFNYSHSTRFFTNPWANITKYFPDDI